MSLIDRLVYWVLSPRSEPRKQPIRTRNWLIIVSRWKNVKSFALVIYPFQISPNFVRLSASLSSGPQELLSNFVYFTKCLTYVLYEPEFGAESQHQLWIQIWIFQIWISKFWISQISARHESSRLEFSSRLALNRLANFWSELRVAREIHYDLHHFQATRLIIVEVLRLFATSLCTQFLASDVGEAG